MRTEQEQGVRTGIRMIGLSWSRWIADRSARVGGFDGGAVVGERRWAFVRRGRVDESVFIGRLPVVGGFLVRLLFVFT